MANILDVFQILIENDAELRDLMGEGGSVFFNMVPEKGGTYPLLLLRQIGENCEQLLDGSPTKLYDAEFQMDVYGKELRNVQAIAEHLADSFPGTQAAGEGIDLQNIFDFDTVQKAVYEPDLKVWRNIMEFSIHYRRSA